jgi:hypothetical protein
MIRVEVSMYTVLVRSSDIFLLNAFSLNMVRSFPADVKAEEISLSEAQQLLANGFTSAVGHADTAAVFSSLLSVDVPFNRISLSLSSDDSAVVGQYKGPRLEEGVCTLPEGATITWLKLTLS